MDCKLRNFPLNIDEYKVNDKYYCLNVEMILCEPEENSITVDKPETFECKNLVNWEESIHIYFDSISNLKNIPLSHAIRKDLPLGTYIALWGRKE